MMRAGGFAAGREADDAALWAAALREAPWVLTLFDHSWFVGVRAWLGGSVEAVAPNYAVAREAPRSMDGGPRRHSWGEAPDVFGFPGRAPERDLLRRWVADERCRVVAVLGLGGIVKSLLATRLAHDLAPTCERVYWRCLRDAPAPAEWPAGAIGFLAPDDPDVPQGEVAQSRRLLALLGEARCLLVLDNFETILQPGGPVGGNRPGYERYGTLVRALGETAHPSCLLLTSREEPPELGPLRGDRGPVRTLDLGGLGVDDGRALLGDKRPARAAHPPKVRPASSPGRMAPPPGAVML